MAGRRGGVLSGSQGLVELTPLVVARALLLNAPLGVVFGWLAWRRGLEVAMVSHLVPDVLIISTQHLLS